MTQTFRPLFDRVSIKRLAPDEKTEGGIHLPEQAQETKKVGTVLAKGPGRTLLDGQEAPVPVEVGDVVVFPTMAGFELELSRDETITIIRADEILGVLEGA